MTNRSSQCDPVNESKLGVHKTHPRPQLLTNLSGKKKRFFEQGTFNKRVEYSLIQQKNLFLHSDQLFPKTNSEVAQHAYFFLDALANISSDLKSLFKHVYGESSLVPFWYRDS